MSTTTTPAPARATRTLSSRTWVLATLGLVAIVVGLNLLVAWRLDIFGLLRDPRGRQLTNSRHERKAKYMLNFHYVPENFDALVIGASAQANWRLEGLSQYRFYNEAVLGADGTEERMLVEKALERGHFKVALVGISRNLTERHDLQDGLDQANPHEALGSLYAYITIFDRLHDRLLHRRSDFYPDGSWEFPQHKLQIPSASQRRAQIVLDQKAFDDYRIMVQELLAHGTRVVYVVAPHYRLEMDGSAQSGTEEAIQAYTRFFLASMPPAPVIDLDDPKYNAIRDNPNNMIDEDHLSDAGVPIVSKLVIERMHQALHDQ
jgi:hypothetical protein